MLTRSAMPGLLVTPENRAAFAAIQDVLENIVEQTDDRIGYLLYLFGPSGSGKTRLVETLAAELARFDVAVRVCSANDFADDAGLEETTQADVWIVEDLQHLPMRSVNALIQQMDERERRGLVTVFSALYGPSRLQHRGSAYPFRLTNRLAAGLVVAVEPMQAPSRRRLLEALARDTKLNMAPEILDWLAEHLIGGGRQLTGAVGQLKALQALQKRPLRLDDVRVHFRVQIEATAPTIKRITEQVSVYYSVKPKLLLSARRSRDVVVPRQVSMYLARQLTNLSLEKIGAYFGGRDHKTVRHACQKVERAMKTDAKLSGAIRQMHAELV